MRYEEFTIEGRNAVLEAIRAGKTIDKIFVLDGCHDGPVNTIVREAKKGDTIISYVQKERLDNPRAVPSSTPWTITPPPGRTISRTSCGTGAWTPTSPRRCCWRSSGTATISRRPGPTRRPGRSWACVTNSTFAALPTCPPTPSWKTFPTNTSAPSWS